MNEDEKKAYARAVVDGLTEVMADQGQIIEAGFGSFLTAVLPRDASIEQIDLTRMAYFCGAQHLWASIFSMLDPDAEPTDKDMKRMELIEAELIGFLKEIKDRIDLTGGKR